MNVCGENHRITQKEGIVEIISSLNMFNLSFQDHKTMSIDYEYVIPKKTGLCPSADPRNLPVKRVPVFLTNREVGGSLLAVFLCMALIGMFI